MVIDDPEVEVRKHREILFKGPHPDPDQAGTAARLLEGVCGIDGFEVPEPHRLRLRYDVRRITLKEIEEALAEVGFHLENSLLTRMRRALYHFAEETQRTNLGCHHGQGECTRDIFVNRYDQLPHGCRDHRPEHWRRYF